MMAIEIPPLLLRVTFQKRVARLKSKKSRWTKETLQLLLKREVYQRLTISKKAHYKLSLTKANTIMDLECKLHLKQEDKFLQV
jgi:hypothetical protein